MVDPANFRLEVKDFGPIVEANVDFRPLTVFVGPSNTGKSYLAALTYALHQVLMGEPLEFRLRRFRPRRIHRFFQEMAHRDLQHFQSWANEVNLDSEEAPLSSEIEETLIRAFYRYFVDTQGELLAELRRCFGVESFREFHRKPRSRSSMIRISRTGESGAESILSFTVDVARGSPSTTVEIGTLPSVPLTTDIKDHIRTLKENELAVDSLEFFARTAAEEISDSLMPTIMGGLNRPAYYLPAARTGIMHAHTIVVSALLERAQYGGVRRDAGVGVLSGVLGDFLQHLIELEQPPRRGRSQDRHLSPTATELENRVLKGAIRNIPSESGYPSFFYRPEGWKDNLPLMNASSMVSELAPVVLFLRHVVGRRDILIIEEPESHLHPEMQVEFARLLAGAVKAGLRVILTTHSEWVAETIGNLVELSDLPKSRREAMPGGPYALPAEDVGVWLFRKKDRPRGSVVEEVILDPKAGTFGVGYDAIAEELHNEWASAASDPE